MPENSAMIEEPGAVGEHSAAAADSPDSVLSQLDAVARENDDLGRELLRCYEQLSLVFEITEHIANLTDPEQVEGALLQRYAAMLGVSAVLCDRGDGLEVVDLETPVGSELKLNVDLLNQWLAPDIETVRRTQKSLVRTTQQESQSPQPAKPSDAARDERTARADDLARRLPACHALLGALRQPNASTAVVVALRAGQEAPFDASDMMASESVLGYGGHIVSNILMVRHLQKMAFETVLALVSAIDKKDNYTSGHAERVGWLAKFTAAALGEDEAKLREIEWAGLLHDVGKIGVAEDILNKPGKLTDEEFEAIKRHPRMGYEVLKPVASLRAALDGVLYHHENHDGSGYPSGLSGEDIPLDARIIHVVDIFDALTTNRSYRKCFSLEKSARIMREESGRTTDPHITEVFLVSFERYRREDLSDYQQRFAHIVVETPYGAARPPEKATGRDSGFTHQSGPNAETGAV